MLQRWQEDIQTLLRDLGQFERVLPYYPTVLGGGSVAAVEQGDMYAWRVGTRKVGGWDTFDLGEALASTQLN